MVYVCGYAVMCEFSGGGRREKLHGGDVRGCRFMGVYIVSRCAFIYVV